MNLRLLLALFLPLTSFADEGASHSARWQEEFYQKEMARLKERYLQQLATLLAAAKADGDTVSKTYIEGLIAAAKGEKVTIEPELAAVLEPILGKWKREGSGAIYSFKDLKSGVAAEDSFTYSYDPKKREITLVFGEKHVETLKFSSDQDVLRGEYQSGKRYALTRLKQ